jgi:p-hydroxybenzoate 3-monooxygenase
MVEERLVRDGVALGFAGHRVRVDLRALCGQAVTMYGRSEVTKDLIDARRRKRKADFWGSRRGRRGI